MHRFWLVTSACLLLAAPAQACSERGHPDDPNNRIFDVNGWHTGDTCVLSELSDPFSQLLGITQGRGISSFNWMYEDRQYGFFYITVDEQGNAEATFEYSNGKPFDGDNLTGAVIFLDSSGNELFALHSIVGINAAGFGSDVKRYDTQTFSRPPEWWNSIVSLRFYHGRYDEVDDVELWNKVKEVVEAVWNANNQGEDSSSEGQ